MTNTDLTPFNLAEINVADDSNAFHKLQYGALQRARALELPSFEEEVWRYTQINDLDLSKYSIGAPGGEMQARGLTADVVDAAAVLEVVNGEVVTSKINDPNVSIFTELDDENVASGVGSVMTDAVDIFAEYNHALSTSPLVIRIARNSVVEKPIVIRHATSETDFAWFPRVVVIAEENSEATILEHQVSTDVEALICPVTEITAGQSARLKYLTVQELGPRVWQLASQISDIGRDAHVAVSHVAFGGGYARARIDTRMVGSGATGDIGAVYFGRKDTTLDFRTFQKHDAPHTNSNLLFKGAVDDRSRAIYTGMIRIEPDASDVVAYQTNRNLKLSDEAWAESVPNLEIENNDVKCSHASAVGPVDADQRFYLESRGVPSEVAEALVVRGFFAEVLEDFPIPSIGIKTLERISELLSLEGVSL